MVVRFKFRSSVDFDSVDIDGRPFISVRDLRSKILVQKNMKICQDFDLVISDANSGEEFKDENYLVPNGASVIIKRVPAERSVPSVLPRIDLVENLGKRINFVQTIKSSPSVNVDVENFDDFGIDLYPILGESLLDSDFDVDKMNCISNGKADNVVPRCSEPSIARRQNPESSDHSEAIERGDMHCDIEDDTSQTKLKSKMEEHKKLDNVVDASSPAMPKIDLPSELRCSLCNMIFKEAVMIPCCQHSFCEKCICLALAEKAKCPKCSSTKCRVGDLLPNVTLRQAIEHFLESQILTSGSDNDLPKYAPDGESGIQVKEVSYAVSLCQKEPVFPHSPSATGKGSNQVMTESPYESMIRNNGLTACKGSHIIHLDAVGKSAKSASSSRKIEHMRNGENDAVACPANFRSAPEGLESVTDFQGENQPLKLPITLVQKEEAGSMARKRKGPWVNTPDGVGCFTATSKHRKGDRTCFMCGSPDHFIRDCPAASSPYPMFQSGDAMFPGGMSAYGPHYWHGASLPHIRSFANVYSTPGVMPFNPTMVPVTPFGVPYMSSVYAGLSVPCGLMRMGGMVPPMVTGAERPVSRAEFMELQDDEQRHKLLNEHQQREKLRDGSDLEEGYYYNEPQRSHDCKSQLDREKHASYSESDTRISQKKCTRDKHSDDPHTIDKRHEKGSRSSATGRYRRACHYDASSSEIQDMADSSNWHNEERHKHNHKISKKSSERKEHCGSDSRSRHHHSQKEASSTRRKVENDVQRHSQRHHDHSESGLEPNSSRDRKRQWIEKESTHSSRHSRHKVESTGDHLSHERWEMENGLNEEDFREEYHHHHKRKRNH